MGMETIFDLHNDFLTGNCKNNSIDLHLNSVIYAVFTYKLSNPISLFNYAQSLTKNWSIEDLGFLKDLSLLNNYKPRYVSLTWNYENDYACGADSTGTIKPLAIKAIEILEKNGIIFDTAHLNEQSFFDSIAHTSCPFICSHTCFSKVFNHKRNLTDSQIECIVNSGGIVGLTFVSDFLGADTGKKATIKHIIKHIEHFLSKFPLKSLCFGSDFYGSDNLAIDNYFGFDLLKEELIKLNYTNEQIDKIFYINAHEFFKI